MIDLGTLGGTFSQARAVNNVGQVVGRSRTSKGDLHAFLWTATDGMVDMGTLGGDDAQALALNDLGQAVGDRKQSAIFTHAAVGRSAPVFPEKPHFSTP